MNFKELCIKRFSVRSYLPTQVPDSAVEYILECARLAPSAVNKQPWVVYVCRDETVRQQLQAAYNRSWFQQAPMYLVVCHKTDASWVRPADQKNHGDIDIAILSEHICLAAAEQGLGSCWVCNFDPEGVRTALNLEANLEPAVIIPLGYSNETETDHPKTRKPLNEICIIK